jgi:hypothetical protein
MWALYGPHHNVTREHFEDRWRSLDQVATFHRAGEVRGMVGVRLRTFEVLGEPIHTLYFGQVFVDPSQRGKLLIQRLVTRLFLTHRLRHPGQRLVLWSNALTFNPYLVMAHHLAEFYPSRHAPTPPWASDLLGQIGAHYYPDTFEPEAGTVRKPSRLLHEGTSRITERELANPDIAFYARRNPNHALGHGLLIACPLSFKNLAHFSVSLGSRQWRRSARRLRVRRAV